MLSRVVLRFPKPLECTDSFLTKSWPLWSLMGWVQWCSIHEKYPHRDGLNLSSLVLSTQCCLSSARLSIFYFLLTVSFAFSVIVFLLLFFLIILCVLFSVYSWLKANLSSTILFLFCPFVSPATVHLKFPASTSSPTSHREVATCPLANCASSFSMVQFFSYLVEWLIYQLNNQIGFQNFICHGLIPMSNLAFPLGAIFAVRSRVPRSYSVASFRAVDLLDR